MSQIVQRVKSFRSAHNLPCVLSCAGDLHSLLREPSRSDISREDCIMLHEHESRSGLNHLTLSQDSGLPHLMLTTLISRLSATRLRPLLAQNHPMKMPLLPPSCLSLTAALVSQHVCASGSAGATRLRMLLPSTHFSLIVFTSSLSTTNDATTAMRRLHRRMDLRPSR